MASQNYLEGHADRNADWMRHIDDNFSSRHEDIFTDSTVDWSHNFSSYTSTEESNMKSAVNELDDLIEVDFNEVSENYQNGSNDDDYDGTLDMFDANLSGNGLAHNGTGDISFDASTVTEGLVLHELGHTAGLSHPGDQDEDYEWDSTNGGDYEKDTSTFSEWSSPTAAGPDGGNVEDTTIMDGSFGPAGSGFGGVDEQALRYLHGNETDDLTGKTVSGGTTTVHSSDELDIFGSATSQETIKVEDGGEVKFTANAGSNGRDEIVLEGEVEEFVFKQDGSHLNMYDDDGTAAEIAIQEATNITFSKFGSSDGAAGAETYDTLTAGLSDVDNDGQQEMTLGSIDISENGRVFDADDAIFI